ncbi:histidine phosphatase family protein [Enterococcus casseliflavus]|uniref:histidine phosphatase family protein n=1 Tax=Enterococcus casseliflavus TaxID=37734 RepID=UPI00115F4BFE|nr:histidine phosphatase family protein [Enterococcus casseliflavus]
MLLYLVRHGQTYLNKYGKMQGWSDAPLTSDGQKMAIECGQKLKNISFSAVYSSDFGRTISTAKLIMAESSKNLPKLKILPEFRETFFGSFEGELADKAWLSVAQYAGFSSVEQLWHSTLIDATMNFFHDADQAKDADNYETFWSRLQKGLDYLNGHHEKSDKVLLVTHGNVIRNIAYHFDKSIDCGEELFNSGITIIQLNGFNGKIVSYNQSDL